MKPEWEQLQSTDCDDSFLADALRFFRPRTSWAKHEEHVERDPGLCKEEFRCSEMLFFSSKTYCCNDAVFNKLDISCKGLKKQRLEQSGDGPLEKYRTDLDYALNIISTNRGFRKKRSHHCNA